MACLCLNSSYLPPTCCLPRKQSETYLSPSSASSLCSSYHSLSSSINIDGINAGKALKPIVINGDPPTFVSAPGRRIVAVGDLHGDLAQTRHALEMAGVLSSDGQDLWIGRETVLVQLGDILDRGEDEIAILSLLRSLDAQAKAQGGAVFQINGNHETMNVEGDFRYVDSGAFDECTAFLAYLEDCEYNWDNALVSWIGVSKMRKDRRTSQNYWGPWNLVKVNLVETRWSIGMRIGKTFCRTQGQ
uniref:Uncharacterized protein At1g18480 n=1 Tax=Rhizophora mucronata TaxID=61149 RepID=A0A2P2JUR5_RHIMU